MMTDNPREYYPRHRPLLPTAMATLSELEEIHDELVLIHSLMVDAVELLEELVATQGP